MLIKVLFAVIHACIAVTKTANRLENTCDATIELILNDWKVPARRQVTLEDNIKED